MKLSSTILPLREEGPPAAVPPPLLIIGYGNLLRGDDGAGPRVAEAVAATNLPGVRSMACQQLAPELAEAISQAQAVIFVDADFNAKDEVELRRLEAKEDCQVLGHAADPRWLLAVAKKIYGRSPPAWLLAIPAVDFGFGHRLSERAEAGIQAALKLVNQKKGGAFERARSEAGRRKRPCRLLLPPSRVVASKTSAVTKVPPL